MSTDVRATNGDGLPPNPIDRLFLAGELVRATGSVGPALAAWLEQGAARHVDTGESLDRALGLNGALGRSPRFELLYRRRNAFLRDALEAVGGDAALLLREIAASERVKAACPDGKTGTTEVRRLLHRAAATGLHMPRSYDGIRRAVLACKGGAVPSDTANAPFTSSTTESNDAKLQQSEASPIDGS